MLPRLKLPTDPIGQALADTVARHGSREALVVPHQGVRWTWQELSDRAHHVAAGLLAMGLQPGDRVALQTPNSLTVPVVAFGVFKAGCVLVNINPLYTPSEMAHQLRDASPKVIVITDMFTDKLAEAGRSVPLPRVVVTRVAELMPRAVRGVIGLVQKHWDRSIPAHSLPHIRLPEALASWPLELSGQGLTLTYTFDTQKEETGIAELLRALAGQGIDFKDLQSSESSLEDIFVSLVHNKQEART